MKTFSPNLDDSNAPILEMPDSPPPYRSLSETYFYRQIIVNHIPLIFQFSSQVATSVPVIGCGPSRSSGHAASVSSPQPGDMESQSGSKSVKVLLYQSSKSQRSIFLRYALYIITCMNIDGGSRGALSPQKFHKIVPPLPIPRCMAPMSPSFRRHCTCKTLNLKLSNKLHIIPTQFRNVYTILAAQGIAVCGIISLFFIPHIHSYFQEMSFYIFWSFWAIGTIIACFVTTLYKLMRKPPVNLVMVTLVTISAGVIFGTLAVRVEMYVHSAII